METEQLLNTLREKFAYNEKAYSDGKRPLKFYEQEKQFLVDMARLIKDYRGFILQSVETASPDQNKESFEYAFTVSSDFVKNLMGSLIRECEAYNLEVHPSDNHGNFTLYPKNLHALDK